MQIAMHIGLASAESTFSNAAAPLLNSNSGAATIAGTCAVPSMVVVG
jgi:hypothetical protein